MPSLNYRDPSTGEWVPLALTGPPGPPGTTDHGAQAGLSDDDHPQYVKKAGDTMTGDLNVSDAGINVFGAGGSAMVFPTNASFVMPVDVSHPSGLALYDGQGDPFWPSQPEHATTKAYVDNRTRVASGYVAGGVINVATEYPITFPAGLFTSTPIVQCTWLDDQFGIASVKNVTTSGVVVSASPLPGGATITRIAWLAVQHSLSKDLADDISSLEPIGDEE